MFNLHCMLESVEIKQEPPDDEVVTENGQAKDEDDAKEAGELVSWQFYHHWHIFEGLSKEDNLKGSVLETSDHIENSSLSRSC